MDLITTWALSREHLDITNHNYKNVYGRFSLIPLHEHIDPSKVAPGRLTFLIICDNKRPVTSSLYNGCMYGITPIEGDGWESTPVPFSLWTPKKKRGQRRVGSLSSPTISLIVPITFMMCTLFGAEIDSHAALIYIDVDNQIIEFFEPNGETDRLHASWFEAVKTHLQPLFQEYRFFDVGDLYKPHCWYSGTHGVCSAWVVIYAMLRADGQSPAQIGLFLRQLGRDLVVEPLRQYLDEEGLQDLLREHQIPLRYIPTRYLFEVGKVKSSLLSHLPIIYNGRSNC